LTKAVHFACTACGKCCYGQLPLTVNDALANAGRFPLALLWTPLRKGSKDFPLVSRLGVTVPVPKHSGLAALVVPTSYIPPSMPCPALGSDNLCSIHLTKPTRCRTMPFYPYRDEQFQHEVLKPQKGWECDTSTAAPIVFQNNRIVDRSDFDCERRDLEEQVPLIRQFAAYQFKYSPMLAATLALEGAKARPGQIVTSLSSFLTATRHGDARAIAQLQQPVLAAYCEKTEGVPALQEFHLQYGAWLEEMRYMAR
jgi:Fe-S-cluster containining protein